MTDSEAQAMRLLDHSAWDHRKIIHSSDDKVHVNTRFTRYRADDTKIGVYDSVYVVTKQDGHWGVQARSSFAPQSRAVSSPPMMTARRST